MCVCDFFLMFLLDASSTATQKCFLCQLLRRVRRHNPAKKLKQRGEIIQGEGGVKTGLRQTTAICFSSQKQYLQLIFSSNINIAYAVHQHQLFRTHTAYIRFPYLEPLCGRNALKAPATSYLSNSEMWQKKSL